MNGMVITILLCLVAVAVVIDVLISKAQREKQAAERLHQARSGEFELALHLRSATRAGREVPPYIDTQIERALAWCPRTRSGKHVVRKGECLACCLTAVPANQPHGRGASERGSGGAR